jgi:Trk K+ transport system NAD-binding subunit
MSNLYLIVPTLITIMISMLIVRAGAIALMMTGMNFEKAKFQALSAFSGTGFTTREAERVVNNPQRRKIVSTLMILGNAGIVTVIVTATSSFAMAKGMGIGLNALVLLSGILLIYFVVRNTPVARLWENYAQARLSRLKIFEEEASVDELLHITEGYGVVRIQLLEGAPFIGQTLADINAGLEHSFVLGMERDKEWLPRPRLNKKLRQGDYLVIYGQLEDIADHFG